MRNESRPLHRLLRFCDAAAPRLHLPPRGRPEERIMQRRIESKVTKPATPVRVEHDIPGYLASDEALVHILNRYPAELLDITRYDFAENGKVTLTPGQRGRAEGET